MTKFIITTLPDPHGFSPDALTDLLRSGARGLIQQAVAAELSVLLETYSGDRIEDGRARLVRHGHQPEHEVMTGIGAVPVKVPACETGATPLRKSGSPRQSCRPTCAKPNPSKSCCPGCISVNGVCAPPFS